MASMAASPQEASLFVSNLLTQTGRSSDLELHHGKWQGRTKNSRIEFYQIPMEEFDILHLVLKANEQEVIHKGIHGPSIWIVMNGVVEVEASGQREKLQGGQVIFVKPESELTFSSIGDVEVEAWAAFCEV
jgi:mannose-6-phosphate isomerase class I